MAIPEATGKLWLGSAMFLIVLLHILFVVGGAGEDPTPFLGGVHWQAGNRETVQCGLNPLGFDRHSHDCYGRGGGALAIIGVKYG